MKNYTDYPDGTIICNLFDCVCVGKTNCGTCGLMKDYTEYNNREQEKTCDNCLSVGCETCNYMTAGGARTRWKQK